MTDIIEQSLSDALQREQHKRLTAEARLYHAWDVIRGQNKGLQRQRRLIKRLQAEAKGLLLNREMLDKQNTSLANEANARLDANNNLYIENKELARQLHEALSVAESLQNTIIELERPKNGGDAENPYYDPIGP